jgi:hypothetical protein
LAFSYNTESSGYEYHAPTFSLQQTELHKLISLTFKHWTFEVVVAGVYLKALLLLCLNVSSSEHT